MAMTLEERAKESLTVQVTEAEMALVVALRGHCISQEEKKQEAPFKQLPL